MSYKKVWLFCLLVTPTLFALWGIFFATTPKIIFNRDTLSPDSYMENIISTVMDKEGHIKMKIVAPRVIHFNKDDESKLTMPHITLYRGSTMPWQITAQQANAKHGIDEIQLLGNVRIHHLADEKSPNTLIKTQHLTIFPHQQIGKTKDFITLNQPQLTVQSVGMIAHIDTGEIKLLSQVRGHYAPNN